MENTNEKIKKLRKLVLEIFCNLFLPHVFVCLLTMSIATNPIENLKWQMVWFLIYFTMSLSVYVFAPMIINRKYR